MTKARDRLSQYIVPSLLALSLALLLCSKAFGAIPEIPGNGKDDGDSSGTFGSCSAGYHDATLLGVGCDLDFLPNDKDGDGYTSSSDCDDTNPLIYPGVSIATGCTGSDYKTCQSSGSYTSCQTGPLCESTGSGVCKYVNCGSGNNSNSGTYASPYLTLGKVSGGSPGSEPASPHTLAAGDVVYIVGSTACSTTFANGGDGNDPTQLDITTDGTSANRITVKRYPGATATLEVDSGERGIYITGDYITLSDLKVVGATTPPQPPITITNTSTNVTISRVFFDTLGGDGSNNFGCIYSGGANYTSVDHSFFQDCYPASGNIDNTQSIIFLNDDTGGGHSVTRSHMWYTRATHTNCASGDKCGQGIRFKHGVDKGQPQSELSWITIGWPARGVWSDTSNLYVHNVLIVNPYIENAFRWLGNDPDSNGTGSMRISNVTIVDGSLLNHGNVNYGITEDTIVQGVVVTDDATTYNVDGGMYRIDPYGSDSNETQYRTSTFLVSNNNCFYNSTTAIQFNYFKAVAADGFGAGNSGGYYTFSQWKSNVSYDVNSFETNPSFDSQFRATAASCRGKGWLTIGGAAKAVAAKIL